MNVRVLIDNIVRQTTVLIAQLATAAGLRAPLAHIANQVFLDLVTQLEADGLGRKVVADMFGLALRSYQLKVQRLSQSATEQSKTLWQAVLDFLREQDGTVSRARVLERFRHDDESLLRGVLHDLVDSGLVFKSGRGHGTSYRAATDADLRQGGEGRDGESLAALVLVTLHRLGRAERAQLLEELVIDEATLSSALESLVAEGRIERVADKDGAEVYQTGTCVLPLGAAVGWEAAVFDHFQAMVTAIGLKLDAGETRARLGDAVGGSTYHFDVWPEHPHEAEVRALFGRLRRELSELREAVSGHTDSHRPPADGATRFTLYLGQLVRPEMIWTTFEAEETT